MSAAAALIRRSRVKSGLTQRELADRLGKAQATIAKLEREGANPTLATLTEAMRATGFELELSAKPIRATLDEQQILAQLRMTPTERAHAHDAAYRGTQDLVRNARRVDG
jgi:transcriptional regulator with XRE-family HTH domain